MDIPRSTGQTAQNRQTKATFLGPGHFPSSKFYTFIPAEDPFPLVSRVEVQSVLVWSHCLCREKIEQDVL